VRGFTLLEVMVALAILGFALAVLIKSTANNINAAEQSHMMGIATDLARGKMYDVEEQLLKDGFTETEQSQPDPKPFDIEGWPNVYYSYKVEQVELPDFDQLQAMAQNKAAMSGSGSGFGSGSAALGSGYGSADALSGFQNSALGGMLNMFGGSKSGVTGAQGGALIQTYYSMFQQILKVSVRKVTLTVTWKVMGADNSMKVVCFFTDAAAMDKILNGLGAQDLDDVPQGSGAGSGLGSGAQPTSPVRQGSGS
jgi:general secretion pathway protein I